MILEKGFSDSKMEVKIACGVGPACRPKSSFLYKNKDGFEVEELPGDYEYYIGTLIAAIRLYGLSRDINLQHLREITEVILTYLDNHSFDQNPELKQLLAHAAASIIDLTTGLTDDRDAREKKERMLEMLEDLEHLLDSF